MTERAPNTTNALRIMWLTSPYTGHGGVHRHLASWVEAIGRKGTYKLDVVVSPVDARAWERAAKTFEPWAEVHQVRLHPLSSATHRGLVQLAILLRRVRPDVLHTISIQADLLGAVARLAAPSVHHVSSVEGRLFPQVKGLRLQLGRVAYRWASSTKIEKIIAISEATARQVVEEFPMSAGRVQVIHSGVDVTQFRLKTQTWPYVSGCGCSVGWMGRLSAEKGIHHFVSAVPGILSRVPNARFLIAGSGPEEGPVRQRITEMALSDRVVLVGWTDHIQEFLDRVHVLVFTSPIGGEGLPWVVLEAHATGTPVVATCTGGVPEAVADQRTGLLLRSTDPKEISEKVAYILQHRDIAANMGREGRKRLEQRFTREREVEELLKVYASIQHGTTT